MKFLEKQFAIDMIKKRGDLSLREVANTIKTVSASTLNRLENGNVPDLVTYATLCKWMGVSLNKYFDKSNEDKYAEIFKEIIEHIACISNVAGSKEWVNEMNKKLDKI